MFRSLLALSASALVSSSALAATYSATPAVPVKESRMVVRDTLFACGPRACVGSTPNGRPLVLCQSLARKAGRLDTFLVDGRALSSAELELCNASARSNAKESMAQAR